MGTLATQSGHVGSDRRPPLPEETGPAGRGIGHIMVCLDRSSLSEQLLPYAVSLAKTFGSSMTLLHVLQPPHEGTGAHGTDPLDWEIARQEAAAHLERVARATSRESGLRVDSRVDQGRPAERIVALSRELGADLTVLSNHGQSGMTESEMGSTVQQVLGLVRRSVLIGRAVVSEPRRRALSRILVPLDGSQRTESVLPTVARIAAVRGAEVLLVHVVHEPQPTAVLSVEGDLKLAQELAARIEAGARRYLERIHDQLLRDVPSVRTRVIRQTDERESLLRVIDEENVDLVVLSAHGATCNPARPFGSMTSHLVMHAHVPVLVLSDLPTEVVEKASDVGERQLAPPLRATFTPEEE